MKTRVVLVDDEALALQRLERMLEPYRGTVEIVGKAENGADAVTLINELKPDAVFLDVQMPELNGFDVIERLAYDPLVVFTTAFDQYALKAFDVYSVDYLLKPIDPQRLKLAVDKLHRLTGADTGALQERLAQALESLQRPQRNRIQVKVGDRIKLIALAEVVFLRASDKYVEVHTDGDSHLVTQSLAALELELPPKDFARVHRSTIVNINFIRELAKGFDGNYEVRMKDRDATVLPVSRRYRSRLELG